MLSHVYIGITNFERALAFYQVVMDTLGFKLKFSEPEKPWAGWMRPGADRPLFLIGHPYNGEYAAPGNGQMMLSLLPIAMRSIGAMREPSPLARGTKACRGYGRTITPITTAPISAIPTATRSVFAATIR